MTNVKLAKSIKIGILFISKQPASGKLTDLI